jgi:phosphomannomutase
MPRLPQAKRNVAVSQHELSRTVLEEVTEPLVRVLVEMENAQDAETMCASIAALVERELG